MSSASLEATAAAFADLLKQVVAGEIVIDAAPVPLTEAAKAWSQPDDGRRIVFVPMNAGSAAFTASRCA
jgi:hypothetical protein